MCFELTPRAPILDGRMERIMQPWSVLIWKSNTNQGIWLESDIFIEPLPKNQYKLMSSSQRAQASVALSAVNYINIEVKKQQQHNYFGGGPQRRENPL